MQSGTGPPSSHSQAGGSWPTVGCGLADIFTLQTSALHRSNRMCEQLFAFIPLSSPPPLCTNTCSSAPTPLLKGVCPAPSVTPSSPEGYETRVNSFPGVVQTALRWCEGSQQRPAEAARSPRCRAGARRLPCCSSGLPPLLSTAPVPGKGVPQSLL